MNLEYKQNITIDRAINELRSGRPIIIQKNKIHWVFFPLESIDKKNLLEMIKNSPSKIFSVITNKKANSLYGQSLGYKGSVNIPFKINDINWLKSIHSIKQYKPNKKRFRKDYFCKSPKFINEVINLAKNAKVIPCLIGCEIDSKSFNNLTMKFDFNQINNQYNLIAKSTKLVSQSKISLTKDNNAKIMIFKSYIGGLEHVVIKIGKPKNNTSVNLRIQSACLTGEVFHSMMCDCNEQLHQSINYLKNNGGGYIIHLEQEGRGIGLVNKIKAYDLQNKGMDTYMADITMGFIGDERDFSIATYILKFLKIKKVNLITNNADKILALKNGNISVTKRIQLYSTINKFNIKYITERLKKTKYQIAIK